MSYAQLPIEIQHIAEQELTPTQLRCFILQQAGLSTREISDKLELSRTSVRDHLRLAHTALRRRGVASHPNGALYLQETA